MENEGVNDFSFQFSVFRIIAGLLLASGLGLAKGGALEWREEGGHRWAELPAPAAADPASR